ncbi:MAG: phosphoribosylamine--glycine ligase [Candidatus Nitrosocaldaceae archaeon]
MSVIIIGSGGREHALGWKIRKDNDIELYYSPGNGGTSKNLTYRYDDEALISFAKEKKAFTIVGPEEPLAKGVVDKFKEHDLPIFGPTKDAAILEYSKVWAKEFMKSNFIDTAEFKIFSDPSDAKEYVKDKEEIVIKADGLAAGKGVFVCKSNREAIDAIDRIMIKREFGYAGDKIVVEELLKGKELSFIVISDGKKIMPLATSKDHKKAYDNDQGPNTGGMGAYSPAIINNEVYNKALSIMQKAIDGMRRINREFRGFLYGGMMIVDNKPYILEFNVRLGDPETQVILPRMESNLLEYIKYAYEGRLDELEPIKHSNNSAVCVILSSKGYPGSYEKGKVIHGLDKINNAIVFHAGTTRIGNDVITNGGRVLGVTALGKDLESARKIAYDAISMIDFDGMYYRRDIGKI